MYKVLYCSDEFESYILYSKRMKPTSKFILFLEDVALKCNPMLPVYTYTRVPFSPLIVSQAVLCLRSLVEGIRTALCELHHLGLTYNDIRLPNICFNSMYQVVLIDMDRCFHIGMCHSMSLNQPPTHKCVHSSHKQQYFIWRF